MDGRVLDHYRVCVPGSSGDLMPKPKKDKAMAHTPLPEPRWYAVHTRAGCEKAAAEELGRQGFWTWYPFDRYRVRRRRPGARDLVTWVERPHFSRYVFVALRYLEEAIGDVNDAEGVARVVCERFTGRPLQIPTVIMDALMDEALVTLDSDHSSKSFRWRLSVSRAPPV